MTSRFTALLLVLLATACGGDRPTMPTPIAPSVPPTAPATPPPSPTYHIVGFVVEEGAGPVGGAEVAFPSGQATMVSVVTDATGFYEAIIESPIALAQVRVQKGDYETSEYLFSLDREKETTRNLRLHRILSITAGQSTQRAVSGDDPSCGVDLERHCRRVRIRSLSQGMLTIEVVPDSPGAEYEFGLAIGGVSYPHLRSPSRISVRVGAGSETAVDVLLEGPPYQQPPPGPHRFTLNTVLQAD